MVVGFIATYAISAYHHLCCEFESRPGEVYSIQHYVIKFVRDFIQATFRFKLSVTSDEKAEVSRGQMPQDGKSLTRDF
jgi:hypothetical protein